MTEQAITFTMTAEEARKLIGGVYAGMFQARSAYWREQEEARKLTPWQSFIEDYIKEDYTAADWAYHFVMEKIFAPQNAEVFSSILDDKEILS